MNDLDDFLHWHAAKHKRRRRWIPIVEWAAFIGLLVVLAVMWSRL